MLTLLVPVGLTLLAVAGVPAAVWLGPGWWVWVAMVGGFAVIGWYDVLQRRHSILRNYPVLGHMRFLLESIRPEIPLYFVERNIEGRPFDRDTRTIDVKRLIQGADYTNAARAMMMATGCLSYQQLYHWLADGELLAEPPPDWADDWAAADPDTFHRTIGGRIE